MERATIRAAPAANTNQPSQANPATHRSSAGRGLRGKPRRDFIWQKAPENGDFIPLKRRDAGEFSLRRPTASQEVKRGEKPSACSVRDDRWCKSEKERAVAYKGEEWLARLQLLDGFEEDVAYDGQAAGADFVHGVLGGVPVVGSGIEGDDVGGGDVAF